MQDSHPTTDVRAAVNQVFYHSSESMTELPTESVHLVVTSPPYFNVKEYHRDGRQTREHSISHPDDFGAIRRYEDYLDALLSTWRECARVLVPNGKLAINAPLMPMPKSVLSTHHNRHIFNIYGDIERSILREIPGMYLLDIYLWNRTNSTKRLMFGSYPHPRNFYAQNTVEFIGVLVKQGKPKQADRERKAQSTLTGKEWREYTKQVWDIPVPNKGDIAHGTHAAIMPEEIARRCIRLFTCVDDVVLDPYAGSGTTLKVAKELRRAYVGYEIYGHYRQVIDGKLKLEQSQMMPEEETWSPKPTLLNSPLPMTSAA